MIAPSYLLLIIELSLLSIAAPQKGKRLFNEIKKLTFPQKKKLRARQKASKGTQVEGKI